MRPLILAFLILAPFIALAQNYHFHALPVLSQAPVAHLAQNLAKGAGAHMASMMHAVQAYLG